MSSAGAMDDEEPVQLTWIGQKPPSADAAATPPAGLFREPFPEAVQGLYLTRRSKRRRALSSVFLVAASSVALAVYVADEPLTIAATDGSNLTCQRNPSLALAVTAIGIGALSFLLATLNTALRNDCPCYSVVVGLVVALLDAVGLINLAVAGSITAKGCGNAGGTASRPKPEFIGLLSAACSLWSATAVGAAVKALRSLKVLHQGPASPTGLVASRRGSTLLLLGHAAVLLLLAAATTTPSTDMTPSGDPSVFCDCSMLRRCCCLDTAPVVAFAPCDRSSTSARRLEAAASALGIVAGAVGSVSTARRGVMFFLCVCLSLAASATIAAASIAAFQNANQSVRPAASSLIALVASAILFLLSTVTRVTLP